MFLRYRFKSYFYYSKIKSMLRTIINFILNSGFYKNLNNILSFILKLFKKDSYMGISDSWRGMFSTIFYTPKKVWDWVVSQYTFQKKELNISSTYNSLSS